MIFLPLLGLLISVATGWAVEAWLWPRHGWRADELLWRLCMAMGIGFGLSSCATFLWLTLAPTRESMLYVIDAAMLVGSIVLAWRGKRGLLVQSPIAKAQGLVVPEEELLRVSGLTFRVFNGVLIACAGVAVFMNMARLVDMVIRLPHGTWDAWMIWKFRARFLYRGGAGWASALVDVWAWSHPDYPLLLPLTIARLWHYLGIESTIVPSFLAVLFALLTLGLLFAALSRLRGPGCGALACLFLAATPLLGKTAGAQCADVPVGFYMLAASCALVLAGRATVGRGRLFALVGLLASAGAWTKNEGILFAAGIIGSMIFLAVVRSRRYGPGHCQRCGYDLRGSSPGSHCPECGAAQVRASSKSDSGGLDWDDIGMTIAGALPITLFLIAMKLMLSAQTDLFQHHTVRAMVNQAVDMGRHRLIWAYFLGLMRVLPDPYMALGLILYMGAMGIWGVASLRRAFSLLTYPFDIAPVDRPAASLIALVLVSMCVGFYIVYIWSPNDLDFHLATSLERIVIQLWPTFVFLLFFSLRAPPISPVKQIAGMESAA